MVARVVPQSARRRHAESRKPDLRRGECFQVQEYQQVDFLLGPATGKQGAVGHERRHRLFAYAWCLYPARQVNGHLSVELLPAPPP